MSENKLKYFEVTQMALVTAKNKAEAKAIARGRRGVPGKLLHDEGDVIRISASDAKDYIQEHDHNKTMTA